MLIGVSEIKVLQTVADEYGVYRMDNTPYYVRRFLMFSTSTRKEACYYASRMADVLKVPYHGERMDTLPTIPDTATGTTPPEIVKPTSEQQSPTAPLLAANPPSNPPRKRKVSGVGKRIREFLDTGKTDQDIINTLLPEYLAVGRSEKDAIWTIRVSLNSIKQERSK